MSRNACLGNIIQECTSHLEHVLTCVGNYLQNLISDCVTHIKHVVECTFLCPDNYWRNTRQCANITVPVVSAIIGHNVLVFAFLHHCYLLLDGGDVITWRMRERTRERMYTEQVLVHNTYLYIKQNISCILLQNAVIDKSGTDIESGVKITYKI